MSRDAVSVAKLGVCLVIANSICNCLDGSTVCNGVPEGCKSTCGSDTIVKMFLGKTFAFDKHQKSLRKAAHADQWIIYFFLKSLRLLCQRIFIQQIFCCSCCTCQLDWSLKELFTEVVLKISFGGWDVSQDHSSWKTRAALSEIRDYYKEFWVDLLKSLGALENISSWSQSWTWVHACICDEFS